ncbi:REST corepressor 3-like [Aphelenchoides fujianensis]|nr:REST corepressor 3-like [Aphelenchoides fujianensis]
MAERDDAANIEERAIVEERPISRAGSVSSSSELDDGGSSTPPSARKTRSSGPVHTNNFESITTTRRSTRKRDPEFMKTATSAGPRIGSDFQIAIPELAPPSADEAEPIETPQWKPTDWLPAFDAYLDLARVCRKVPMDVALKHLYEHEFDLLRALETIEELPVPDVLLWDHEDVNALVKKVVIGRKVVTIQKHFADLGKKNGMQVFEKRAEVVHRLCFGPTRWLCPQLQNNTEEEVEVIQRKDCINCSTEKFKSGATLECVDKLCNSCDLYAQVTGKYRPFSTTIEADELVKSGHEGVEEYESDDEHFDCFNEPILEDLRRPTAWTMDEEETCIRGFRQHGLNFEEIAEMLPEKTERDVQQFYVNNRQRYCIDAIAEDRERERETPPIPRPRRAADDDRTPTPAVESGEEPEAVAESRGPSDRRDSASRLTSKSQVVEATA